MPPIKYLAVLFDFDGTLVPTVPLWIKAYHMVLRRYNIAISDADLLGRCFFRDWGKVAADLGVCSGEELRRDVIAAVEHSYADTEPFPLAQELVQHCRLHGLQTALVTSCPRNIVWNTLRRLEMAELFDFILCGDEVKNHKPHPEPVLTTLAALNRSPKEAIMVGDSHVDILAGRAAGTFTALYVPDEKNGIYNTETARAARATLPDHIFVGHGELPALLGLPKLLA